MSKSIHSKRQKKFCQLLRLQRKKAVMTQADVAKKLKRPQSFVSDYERGERRLDVPEFLSIADAIGFRASDLIAELQEE